MTNKEKFYANIKKEELLEFRGYRCEVCGASVTFESSDLAHRIPKGYVKIYGAEIIHHPFNLVITCKGSKKCNDSVLMKPATQPIKAAELIQRIQEDLCQTKK